MPTLTHPDGRRKTLHKSATARIEALQRSGFVLDDAKPAAKKKAAPRKTAKKATSRKATKPAAPTPEQSTSDTEANPDPESTED